MEYDGSIPDDNPFDDYVFSLGHRNPQGLDWHPDNKTMVSDEHGPIGHDEINIIHKGGNYGWPEVIGYGNVEGFIDPVYETGDKTIAPSGASFIKGDLWKEYYGYYAIGCLRGQKIVLVGFNNNMEVKKIIDLYNGIFGRIRDVAIDIDGSILIATSNRDGRGSPRSDDDKIVRIKPL